MGLYVRKLGQQIVVVRCWSGRKLAPTGTHWGTEQRQQLDYSQGNRTGIVDQRWRNVCGIGGTRS